MSMRNALGFAILAALALLLAAMPAKAQSAALAGIRSEFKDVSASVMKAAQKAPESLYSYQPTPDVFTYRKMLLHIAGASYSICAGFQGNPGQGPKVDANKEASKQEVLETLTAAFSYCDASMGAASDATLAEIVTAPSGTKRPKSYYVSHLLAHTSLHYGNIVTYMRLNKMSPGD
ncbi:MAG: DinB family protein [Bryobacterales bacterium]|nr:DinB family protein [Bryobacterales bacterium]